MTSDLQPLLDIETISNCGTPSQGVDVNGVGYLFRGLINSFIGPSSRRGTRVRSRKSWQHKNWIESLETRTVLSGNGLLTDINPGAANSDAVEYLQIGGITYFVATDAVNGRELWKTDGTEAGTTIVKDINAGTASSSPRNLVELGAVFTSSHLIPLTELSYGEVMERRRNRPCEGYSNRDWGIESTGANPLG